jgi:hypothetical protein
VVESEFQSIVGQEAIDLLVDLCGPGSSQSGTNCRVVEDHLKQFARAIAPKPPAVSSESAGVEDDRLFIAAALDFSNAGPNHFSPGFLQYRDLALAASRVSLAAQPTTEQPGGVTRERERCARIAENFTRASRDWVPDSLWDNITKGIAAAIRGEGGK